MKHDPSSTLARLRRAREFGEGLFVVHYACESLAVIRPGAPAVSAVGFRSVHSEEPFVYSVADRADEGEPYVLRRAFELLRENATATFVHWRMDSSEFGFAPLAHRHHDVLGEEVQPPSPERRIDLAKLISQRYGENFADHRQLENLIDLNGLVRRRFRSGEEEARLFKTGDHASIRRSLSEKLGHLAALLGLVIDGDLETKWQGRRVKFADGHLDSVRVVEAISVRLVDVARQLARRHAKRDPFPLNDEYDYQDLFHAMLRVFFEDVRAESYVAEYAGGASRVDFRLPKYRMAIELKHPKTFGDKELADQIIIDIKRYQQIKDIRHLMCVVFDKEGTLANPRGLEADLSRNEQGIGVIVKIIDR